MEVLTNLKNEELIRRFEEDCKIRGLTEGSIKSYKSCLRIFSSFLKINGIDLISINRDILRSYVGFLREKRLNYKTIENHFSAISALCEYMVYEGIIAKNVALEVRKRYLHTYKSDNNDAHRKLISVEEMVKFINSIADIRDKAMVALLAKTGIRRKELVAIDLDDINWQEMSIILKPTAKRSNRIVFFDDETAVLLKKWISKREAIAKQNCKALFISYQTGERLDRSGLYNSFIYWAERACLHNPNSDRIEDHFTPHCCRHWFTTWLRRNGMPREYIQELRGDARSDAIDIYYHIDREELRKSYLACIPKLGIA
ncbi:MAG: tyrosine-type recombinase/integrase [Thermoplasmatales archaeon]|nr:tyrosine-type recombinase/integrase [Thermoplasmatales archaeon]